MEDVVQVYDVGAISQQGFVLAYIVQGVWFVPVTCLCAWECLIYGVPQKSARLRIKPHPQEFRIV